MAESNDERAEIDRICFEETAPQITAGRAERERLVDGYQHLVAAIEALLFRHDPIGINFGSNTGEYRAEAQTIVPRLRSASDEGAVLQIVHEEFVTWFGVAGPMQSYRPIAADIWRLWSE